MTKTTDLLEDMVKRILISGVGADYILIDTEGLVLPDAEIIRIYWPMQVYIITMKTIRQLVSSQGCFRGIFGIRIMVGLDNKLKFWQKYCIVNLTENSIYKSLLASHQGNDFFVFL